MAVARTRTQQKRNYNKNKKRRLSSMAVQHRFNKNTKKNGGSKIEIEKKNASNNGSRRKSLRKDAWRREEKLRKINEARRMEWEWGRREELSSMEVKHRKEARGRRKMGVRVAEWGREWNGKVEGEVGNEVYLIWVNLKLKWEKGNHWKWEPNNIKGNGVFPFLFPFPFLKTPNQTPP